MKITQDKEKTCNYSNYAHEVYSQLGLLFSVVNAIFIIIIILFFHSETLSSYFQYYQYLEKKKYVLIYSNTHSGNEKQISNFGFFCSLCVIFLISLFFFIHLYPLCVCIRVFIYIYIFSMNCVQLLVNRIGIDLC